jgi:hypothetical protein
MFGEPIITLIQRRTGRLTLDCRFRDNRLTRIGGLWVCAERYPKQHHRMSSQSHPQPLLTHPTPQGVRARYQTAPNDSTTLEQLVRVENEGGSRIATACLIRLVRCVCPSLSPLLTSTTDLISRGLSLTCCALMHMQKEPSAELYACFRKSYDEVLKHHHNFLIRSVVTVSRPPTIIPQRPL